MKAIEQLFFLSSSTVVYPLAFKIAKCIQNFPFELIVKLLQFNRQSYGKIRHWFEWLEPILSISGRPCLFASFLASRIKGFLFYGNTSLPQLDNGNLLMKLS